MSRKEPAQAKHEFMDNRRCVIYYCKTRNGPYCCASCELAASCSEVCLNSPDRCFCVETVRSYGRKNRDLINICG